MYKFEALELFFQQMKQRSNTTALTFRFNQRESLTKHSANFWVRIAPKVPVIDVHFCGLGYM